MEQLQQLLQALTQDDSSTIVLGDFNEDILKSNSSIKTFMQRNGFTQLVNKSTTDGGTLIDHVYVHGEIQISMEVKQTYYSYHNTVVLTIKQNM